MYFIYMKYTWNTFTWSTWNAQIDNYYYYYFIFIFYLLLLHYYLILVPYNNKYDSTLRLNYTQKTIFPMLFSDTIANHNRYQATKTLLKDSIAVPTPLEWNPDLMQGSRCTAFYLKGVLRGCCKCKNTSWYIFFIIQSFFILSFTSLSE